MGGLHTVSRINRYILQQLLILFGFFALVLVLIYWINRAVRLFDQLIADGQSAWVFLEFTALTIPAILSSILPIAAFAAAVYQFNRLSADSELSILQATGHSGMRLLRPFLIFGVIVCLMQAVLQNVLVPTSLSTLKVRTVQTAENATARLLQEGTFLNASDDVTLFIKSVSAQGELVNVFLHERSDDRTLTYSAERAFLVRSDTGPKLVLIDGLIQAQGGPDSALTTTRFNDFVIDVGRFLSVGPVSADQIQDLDSLALARADQFDPFEVS
ncbi:MAG: LptF/LptG family permease, partial [Pseudomonadota bacterium]